MLAICLDYANVLLCGIPLIFACSILGFSWLLLNVINKKWISLLKTEIRQTLSTVFALHAPERTSFATTWITYYMYIQAHASHIQARGVIWVGFNTLNMRKIT